MENLLTMSICQLNRNALNLNQQHRRKMYLYLPLDKTTSCSSLVSPRNASLNHDFYLVFLGASCSSETAS